MARNKSRKAVGRTDHLSDLPTELIQRIFDLSHATGKGPKGPASRALRPFDFAARFRRIEVRSSRQLGRIGEKLDADQGFPTVVKSLRVAMREPLKGFNAQNIGFLMRSFSGLVELDLAENTEPACERFFLSPSIADPLPPILRSLSLTFSRAMVDRYRFADLLPLTHLPELRSLSLFFDWEDIGHTSHGNVSSSMQDESVESSSRLQFPRLTYLHISAYSLLTPPTSRLVALVANVPHISLQHRSVIEEHDFRPLLPFLPDSITSLPLDGEAFEDKLAFDDVSINDYLPRFVHLTHLQLAEDSFDDETLASALSVLPVLSSLTFAPRTTVTTETLISLVTEPTRLPSLTLLTLNNFSATRGFRVHVEGNGKLHPEAYNPKKNKPDYDSDPDYGLPWWFPSSGPARSDRQLNHGGAGWEDSVGPGWKFPDRDYEHDHGYDYDYEERRHKFSIKQVDKVVEACRSAGVRVGGTAVEAAKILQEFKEEKRECRRLRAGRGGKQGGAKRGKGKTEGRSG